jgi:hypothetical protein
MRDLCGVGVASLGPEVSSRVYGAVNEVIEQQMKRFTG